MAKLETKWFGLSQNMAKPNSFNWFVLVSNRVWIGLEPNFPNTTTGSYSVSPLLVFRATEGSYLHPHTHCLPPALPETMGLAWNSKTVVTGTQVSNHLYRLNNFIVQLLAKNPRHKISDLSRLVLQIHCPRFGPDQTKPTGPGFSPLRGRTGPIFIGPRSRIRWTGPQVQTRFRPDWT